VHIYSATLYEQRLYGKDQKESTIELTQNMWGIPHLQRQNCHSSGSFGSERY